MGCKIKWLLCGKSLYFRSNDQSIANSSEIIIVIIMTTFQTNIIHRRMVFIKLTHKLRPTLHGVFIYFFRSIPSISVFTYSLSFEPRPSKTITKIVKGISWKFSFDSKFLRYFAKDSKDFGYFRWIRYNTYGIHRKDSTMLINFILFILLLRYLIVLSLPVYRWNTCSAVPNIT